MKKYNVFNNQLLALWIIIPILMFFLVCNATFAYLTASTSSQGGNATTATVQVLFSEQTNQLNSTTITESSKVLPGDALKMNAKVENASNVKIYLLLKFEVNVKKETESTSTNVATKYYSLSNSNLIEITQTAGSATDVITDDTFSSFALSQEKKTTSSTFSATFTFDGETYDNDYLNATASYTLKAYAIQFDNISQSLATQTLWQMANS